MIRFKERPAGKKDRTGMGKHDQWALLASKAMATEDIDKACATTIKVFDNKPFNNKSYGLKTLATFTKVNKEGAEIEKKPSNHGQL